MDKANKNGNQLLDFISENEQITLNSHFLKKTSKLWTFTYPAQITSAQIGFILKNKKWLKSAINCETYNYFVQISSDYRVVAF